jgi:hypothetical protein
MRYGESSRFSPSSGILVILGKLGNRVSRYIRRGREDTGAVVYRGQRSSKPGPLLGSWVPKLTGVQMVSVCRRFVRFSR